MILAGKAIPAQSGEDQLGMFNAAAHVPGGAAAIGNPCLRHIHHGAAAAAHKVRVGTYVAVEPLHAAHRTQTPDNALISEKGQIPVYGGKGDVRMFLPKILIKRFGAGVGLGPLKAGENGVPLPELFAGSFHKFLLSICK